MKNNRPPRQTAQVLSLKVLADQLGVSSATVSNALNHKGKLSAPLRSRILSLAKRNGYQISPHALALQGKRLPILGLMIASIEDGMAQKFFMGADRAAQEKDYSTILSVTSHEGADTSQMEIQSVRRFDLLRIGGVLYLPAANTEHIKVEKMLRTSKIPFVLLYRRIQSDKNPAVVVDHAHGFRLGLDHLLSLGHRRIGIVYSAFYRGPEVDMARAVLREKCPHLPWQTWGVTYDDLGYQKLLSQRVTAFLTMSDDIALSVSDALTAKGYSIPRDISLIGFRDTIVARSMSPKLTTVHVPAAEMGYAAAQWLVARIEAGNASGDDTAPGIAPIDFQFPPTLVVRQSTAPAVS